VAAVRNTAQSVVQSYGFQQIRTPIVEDTRCSSAPSAK
jgi:histidyl-tRNA synthetase